MRNILIHGIGSLLGSHMAARCIDRTDDRVFYLHDASDGFSKEEIADLVIYAACQSGDQPTASRPVQEIANRLHPFETESNVHTRGQGDDLDEVWYFANCKRRQGLTEFESVISICSAAGAKEFNYVEGEAASGGCESNGRLSGCNEARPATIRDQQVWQRCKAQRIGYRFFRTSAVLGNAYLKLQQSGLAFSQFLAVLHSFKAEIEERCPQYFDFHALRCFVPGAAEATVNLISAVQAVNTMLLIARTDGTIGSSVSVVNPQHTPLSSLCEQIGISYGLGLIPVEDFGALNAVDRAFHERSGGSLGDLMHLTTELSDNNCKKAETARLSEEAQIAFLESIRRSQEEARVTRRRRVDALAGDLTQMTLAKGGTELNYCVCGTSGPVVVLLNALGQGLKCWYRLMDNLRESYRVIIWEPRGTESPSPLFGLTDQVDDVDAILQHEGVETCHLVGWCTGPKVAIDFCLRRPEMVASMVFLNSTFKCDGSPEEFDSPYEHNLESLCRVLARKPTMAASVMKNLSSPTEEDEVEILSNQDREAMSVSVLSRMNLELRSEVLAPFKTEVTTLNYAHQLVDFWAHDSRSKFSEIHSPVLLMGTEYDQVVTPASSEMAAGLLPNARHIHVRAATHYCLYDRPDFVANLLRTFFENPEELPIFEQVQDAVLNRA